MFLSTGFLQSTAAQIAHTIMTQFVEHLLIIMSTSYFQSSNKKQSWFQRVLMTGMTLTHYLIVLKMAPSHLVALQMVECSGAVGIAQRQLLRTLGSKTYALR